MGYDERRRPDEPLPVPPNWTFFSGVFTFPWRLQVLFRWAALSLGASLLGIITLVLWALMTGRFGFTGMIMLFFAIPGAWISIWTLSYAAANCVAIVIDTAAGNDVIYSWPEPNWRDWFVDLLYVGYIFLEAGAAAYVMAWILGNWTDHTGGVALVTMFFLFPVILLSAMESNNLWIPVSGSILKSMGTLWWGWLLFYLLSGVLALFGICLLILGVRNFLFESVFVLGPVIAAWVLIYARLLGRLAWRASLEM